MQFGLTLMAVDPPATFRESVRFADTNGYDFMWVADSSLHARYVYSYLTLLAVDSTNLRFGPNCTHPHTRHPALNFNALCTLDELSGGRAIMNLGAGDRPVTELGYKIAKLQTVRDMVTAGRALLQGNPVDYDAEAFQIRQAVIPFGARADLPIYLTVTNQRMCQLAGEIADGILLSCGTARPSLEFALAQVEDGARRAGRVGRDLDIACHLFVSIRDDRAQAREDTRVIAAWYPQTAPRYVELAGFNGSLVDKVQAAYRGGHFHEAAAAAQLIPDEFIDAFTLAGPPDYCVDRINELRALGLEHFEIFPVGGDRHATARRFAQEVIPKLN